MTDRTSSTKYANRRSPIASTTIALPNESTNASTETPAIKVGDKCLILAKQYMDWKGKHKSCNEDLRWMRYICTVRKIEVTVATVEYGNTKKEVPIASIQVISSDTIEAIRNPAPSEAIVQELPPISITELLSLSSTSETPLEATKVSSEDDSLLELCKWLLDAPKLPAPPFQLHPAVWVKEGYLEVLRSEAQHTIDWSQGMGRKHPRHVCGALERDLKALKELAK